jgi:hypothetical protein
MLQNITELYGLKNVTKADFERTGEHKTVHAAAGRHGPEDFPTD